MLHITHVTQITHFTGDLRPSNLLLSTRGDEIMLKLSDFTCGWWRTLVNDTPEGEHAVFCWKLWLRTYSCSHCSSTCFMTSGQSDQVILSLHIVCSTTCCSARCDLGVLLRCCVQS
jgi:hypothetical protein